MTNILPKKLNGFATLLMTLIVLVSVSLTALYTARGVLTEQRIMSNTYKIQHALDAAQAGLNYGVMYLQNNKLTVTNGQTITGALSNGSTYSTQFQFQGATNELIKVVTTGTTADGSAMRIVQQLIKLSPLITKTIPLPLTVRGEVTLDGDANVVNVFNNQTIKTSDIDVAISGNAETILITGTSSNSTTTGPDITENDTTLGAMTDQQLEMDTFGTTVDNIVNSATVTYSSNTDYNYNSILNGQSGVIISINQAPGTTATIDGSTVVGTPDNPVTLVVNGNLNISGNATIHGNVIVMGMSDVRASSTGNTTINGLLYVQSGVNLGASGNSAINGGIVSGGTFSADGTISIKYDPDKLSKAVASSAIYGKLAGSWWDM